MLLTIDVGNTNTHAGIFRGISRVDSFYFPGRARKYAKNIDRVIIVSVSPPRLKECLKELKRFYRGHVSIVGKDLKVPLRSEYNPREIGQDRLVTAYAAGKIYGTPVLVIDFGTAVTFDVVSDKNVYKGGLILPGMAMSLRALHEDTALLPKIGFANAGAWPYGPNYSPLQIRLGKNTEQSIQNGMVYGYASIVEGLVRKFRKKFKRLKIVSTGGNARLIASYTTCLKNMDEELALRGLALVAQNVKS